MTDSQIEAPATTLSITYDRTQHCTAVQAPQGKAVATDACTATGGKGEEISPKNLVGAGLTGCMLFSIGMVALRDGVDLSGTRVNVEISATEHPAARLGAIDLEFIMPGSIPESERPKLERAAELCPIHGSFHPDIPITAHFRYLGS